MSFTCQQCLKQLPDEEAMKLHKHFCVDQSPLEKKLTRKRNELHQESPQHIKFLNQQ